MNSPLGRTACRNCGRTRPPEELDRARWCRACRQRVVDAAATRARVFAIVATVLVGGWAAVVVQPTRFVIAWLLLLAVTYFVTSQIARRVAFEVIRARGIPRTKDDDVPT